jgi:hypothetical protein
MDVHSPKNGIFIGIDPYPYWKPMLGLTNHQPDTVDEKARLAQLLPAQLRCLQERTEALPGTELKAPGVFRRRNG